MTVVLLDKLMISERTVYETNCTGDNNCQQCSDYTGIAQRRYATELGN